MRKLSIFLIIVACMIFSACSIPEDPTEVKFVTHIENTNGSVESYHPSVFYGGENVNVTVYSNKFGELPYKDVNEYGYGYNIMRGAHCSNGHYKYSISIYYRPLDMNYKNSRITIKLK